MPATRMNTMVAHKGNSQTNSVTTHQLNHKSVYRFTNYKFDWLRKILIDNNYNQFTTTKTDSCQYKLIHNSENGFTTEKNDSQNLNQVHKPKLIHNRINSQTSCNLQAKHDVQTSRDSP